MLDPQVQRACHGVPFPSQHSCCSVVEPTLLLFFSPQVYWWNEKYRPRKPKYFNRVHTGYEWNKYNQTHYDSDNPPPKVVQGYKFNIFYPDLIDKQQVDVDPKVKG